MNETLSRFLDALRHADLRVSPAEAIDAYRTAEITGLEDRQLFKDGLAVAMAKSEAEKQIFDAVFDEFFAVPVTELLDALSAQMDGADEAGLSGLAATLAAGDTTTLLAQIQAAADAVGLERMWIFTQRNLFARRILEQMGLAALDATIRDLAQAGGGAGGGSGEGAGDGSGDGSGGGMGGGSGCESNDSHAAALAQSLRTGREQLATAVREYVENEYRIFARDTSSQLTESRLERMGLRNIERRDREHMKRLIRRLAKQLVALHSRPRKRAQRGLLDVRRTLRSNHSNDDVMMRLHWKRKRVDRPKLMVICDVSGSVAAYAQFLLLFVYSLAEVVRDIRSFVLCSNLGECTDFFKHHDLDEAIEKAMGSVLLGATDYGRALQDFNDMAMAGVDRRTTVLFLGDARSNGADARVDLLAKIHDRARLVVWLNPEPETFWGIGDSAMRRYLPHTDFARKVSSLRELQRAIALMLTHGSRL
ncbi:MAG: hypothetical protein ACI8W7_000014 [Gammaproteobacteria bacterium]|jgi:uncharacterized protein with von Willebrand factor type A (vWA) domain